MTRERQVAWTALTSRNDEKRPIDMVGPVGQSSIEWTARAHATARQVDVGTPITKLQTQARQGSRDERSDRKEVLSRVAAPGARIGGERRLVHALHEPRMDFAARGPRA